MVNNTSEVYINRVSESNGQYKATYESISYFHTYLQTILKEKSDTIILKPNILPTDYMNDGLAVTNPVVCAAAADFLKEIGFKKIILAEGTTSSSDKTPDTLTAMKNHGFYEYEDKWEMVDLNKCETGSWFEIYSPGLPGNEYDIEVGIADIMLKYPIVSIAKFKSHDVLGLTLSVKNLMGAINKVRYFSTGETHTDYYSMKYYMHGYLDKHPSQLSQYINATSSKTALAININRLAKVIFPSFSILDAAPAMCGNGPLSGDRIDTNLILASSDPVAVDTVATLITGMDPDYMQYIKNMGIIGLGNGNPSKIKVINADLEKIKREVGFFPMHNVFRHSKFTEREIELLRKLTR